MKNNSFRARRVSVVLYLPLLPLLIALMSCGGADVAMKKGDRFFALGEYHDAAAQYRKAYQQTPAKERKERGQDAKKMAECYRRINYTAKAISAYNNVMSYGQGDSLTLLRLAQQQMMTGNYKSAAANFAAAADTISAVINKMRVGDKDKNNDAKINAMKGFLVLAKSGKQSAEMAPAWKEEGSRYTVKKENNFNARRADFSPVLGGDNGEILYFSSTRNQTKGDELSGITGQKTGDIFMAQKDEKGKWQRPENIDSELNSEYDEGACALTPDGKTMYLTQCVTDPSYPRYATICRSSRSDASWSKPQEVPLSKDTLSNFAHPAVSPDGRWLYFTSDMPGGMGGFDIWRAQLTTTGDVIAIENVGEPINTPGDEKFPTFRPNGDLYFSSDGHPGMGGLDIFIAKPNNNIGATGKKAWIIEHPGYPLNSQGDDFGMTFEGLLNRGFFSSNRGDARGWDHIYSFVNPEIIQTVKGWVYEKDGYELPQALVYMIGDDGTNIKLSVKGDGSFEQQIKPGVEYAILGTCKGYLNHSESLKVEPVEESEEYTLQFPLASITAPVLIDNIFYDFDKATLRPESASALDQLVKLLNENPNVTIELSAHCDYKGSEAYNKQLSQRRAESVVAYLKKSGIAADRLTPVGYGKDRPKTIKKKLTEKHPFLKENDVLTEEFIKQLKSPEEQEICNQLNRRTEFRVLRTTYGMFD